MEYLLTGATGYLGQYLVRELEAESTGFLACSGTSTSSHKTVPYHSIDLTNQSLVTSLLEKIQPRTIIHCAALARQLECWQNPERAHQINAETTAHLAREAVRLGCRLIYVSTDLVFDGTKPHLQEDDGPNPISIYGRTKWEGEKAAQLCPSSLIARISLLFGPSFSGKPSFFDHQVQNLLRGQPLHLFEDEWRTPLSVATAAKALILLSRSDRTGVIHLAGNDRLSRLEMGKILARRLRIEAPKIIATRRGSDPEARPRDVSLDCTRFRTLFPELDLGGYRADLEKMILPPGPID